jgi:hypothetical protein
MGQRGDAFNFHAGPELGGWSGPMQAILLQPPPPPPVRFMTRTEDRKGKPADLLWQGKPFARPLCERRGYRINGAEAGVGRFRGVKRQCEVKGRSLTYRAMFLIPSHFTLPPLENSSGFCGKTLKPCAAAPPQAPACDRLFSHRLV